MYSFISSFNDDEQNSANASLRQPNLFHIVKFSLRVSITLHTMNRSADNRMNLINKQKTEEEENKGTR